MITWDSSLVISFFIITICTLIRVDSVGGLGLCSKESPLTPFLTHLLNSDFGKFELQLSLPIRSSSNQACVVQESRRILGSQTQNIQAIETSPFLSLPEKLRNPLILLIFSETESDFEEYLSNISRHYDRNPKNTEWNPIFFLIHPRTFSEPEEALKDLTMNTFASNFSVGSEVYFLVLIPNSVSLLLLEAYSIRNRTIVRQLPLDPSQPDFIPRLVSSKTIRRSSFRKAPVIAIGMVDADYDVATKFKSTKPGSIELESGFEVEFLRYFRDGLNFTEVAILGTGYVRQGPNGTLTGMATQINSGEGDIAIGAAEFLEYRFRGPDGFSYIHPIFHSNVLAFFKQPPASSVRNIFTQTFTLNLWICVFVLWALLIIVLKVSARFKAKENLCIFQDEQLSEEAVIWATGVLCQQGWYFSPISTSMKITFFFGILFGLICYIAYSAALVSILSVEVVPIRSFGDLLTEEFMITSDSHIPTAKVVVQDLEDSGKIPKLAEGVRNIEIADTLKKLVRSKLAIVTIPDSFYPVLQLRNYSENTICNTISEQVVSARPLKSSCIVRRGSPLKEYINHKLLLMQERGIKSRLLRHYILATSTQCLKTESAFQDDLGLRDVFTAFVLLLFGFAMSFFIVLGEKSVVGRLRVDLEYDMYS